MGNSTSQKRIKDRRSKSEAKPKNIKNKHKYRTRSPSSPPPNIKLNDDIELDLNDKTVEKKVECMDKTESKTHSNIATLTMNDITRKEDDCSDIDSSLVDHYRISTFSAPKHYSHRLSVQTPTLTDVIGIQIYDDDEDIDILSPCAEPIPKSLKSIRSNESIPLSAISKMSETEREYIRIDLVNEASNESESIKAISMTDIQDDDDDEDILDKPIKLRNCYSEPNYVHEIDDNNDNNNVLRVIEDIKYSDELAMPSLKENRAKSEIIYDNDNNERNSRRYRSKYSEHYKISLASSKYSKEKPKEKVNTIKLSRAQSNVENIYNKEKKKIIKKRRKKRKNQYKKRKKVNLMDHIRSRSHSLVNIRSKNKDKEKQYQVITFKCIENDNIISDNNGIVGVYIPKTFVSCVYRFWNDNIVKSSHVSSVATLFFSHLIVNISDSIDIDNKILLNTNNVKYFDMIGWLLRLLMNDCINAYDTLIECGRIHLNAYNTSIPSYCAMLNAIHCTFCQLFEKEYNISLRFMFSIIFIRSIQIMNDDVGAMNDALSLDFLSSLDICLFDSIGIQYLFHFLNQSYCKEISLFCSLYLKFKYCHSQNQRSKYEIAIKMYNECIIDSSQYQINVPFSTYQQIKYDIANINQENIKMDIFDNAYNQMKRLIQQNHWTNFKNTLNALSKKTL